MPGRTSTPTTPPARSTASLGDDGETPHEWQFIYDGGWQVRIALPLFDQGLPERRLMVKVECLGDYNPLDASVLNLSLQRAFSPRIEGSLGWRCRRWLDQDSATWKLLYRFGFL